MGTNALSDANRLAGLVSGYATPLAVILVALGIVLSAPLSPVREQSVAILGFGIVFNTFVAKAIARGGGPGLVRLRLVVNLAVNLLIVFLLGPYWSPIWLLLALTPLAVGIYGTRRATLTAAFGVSAALLAIHATRGLDSPIEWGQQLAHAAFMILVSLMVNELSLAGRIRS